MYKIQKIKAYEILDSRGNPTVEVEVIAQKNSLIRRRQRKAWAQVPSGASTGKYEAVELRDDGKAYHGKGVKQAIKNINEIIAPALEGINVIYQTQIDNIMIGLDGTKNKSKLGANAILPVSMAVARLGAMAKKQKLFEYIASTFGNENLKKQEFVRPFFNLINGGVHAGNKIAFQEFMISPNLGSFEKNYKAASEIYQTLKKILKEKFGGGATLIGDEGGFAPLDFQNEDQALDVLMEAVEKAGYKGQVDFALDVAASEFYQTQTPQNDAEYDTERRGKYNLGFKTDKDNFKSVGEMIERYKKLVQKYPIISIEDPFDEDNFEAFAQLKKELGDGVQIVADDLTVTNVDRIHMAIEKKSANALLLKLNQIGTVTEAAEAFRKAKKAG